MKAYDKIIKLAEIFAQKIAQMTTGESDKKPVVVDAFFGPYGERKFQDFINQDNTNFDKVTTAIQAALKNKPFTVTIGAAVNAPAQSANFLVKTNPPLPANLMGQIIPALNADFQACFGKTPVKKFVDRLNPNAPDKIINTKINESYADIIPLTIK